jgi:hypothetical protein
MHVEIGNLHAFVLLMEASTHKSLGWWSAATMGHAHFELQELRS